MKEDQMNKSNGTSLYNVIPIAYKVLVEIKTVSSSIIVSNSTKKEVEKMTVVGVGDKVTEVAIGDLVYISLDMINQLKNVRVNNPKADCFYVVMEEMSIDFKLSEPYIRETKIEVVPATNIAQA